MSDNIYTFPPKKASLLASRSTRDIAKITIALFYIICNYFLLWGKQIAVMSI